jgi:multidrug resistance efflux pump
MDMRPTTGTRPTWWSTAAVALGAGLLAVACSSGSTPASGTSASGTPSATPSATPTATTVVCQDAADLRTSLHNLTHSSVSKGDVTQLKSNLAQVHTDLTSLITHAKGEWQTQTSALKAALDKLQTAISDLSSSPSASTVAGVAAALGEVAASGKSLLTTVSTRCPSASPS